MLSRRGDNKKTEVGEGPQHGEDLGFGDVGPSGRRGMPRSLCQWDTGLSHAERDLCSFDPVGGSSCNEGEGQELFVGDGPQVAGLPNPGPRLSCKEPDLPWLV